jgi:hypothetical protein
MISIIESISLLESLNLSKLSICDEAGEVQMANDHITNCFNTISELLLDSQKDYASVRTKKEEEQVESTASQWKIIGWIFLAFILLGMLSKC